MFELMTKLHTATCSRCSGPISMLRGEWGGADWYHDDTGEKVCPGAPRAWPIEATIRDVEPLTTPEGSGS